MPALFLPTLIPSAGALPVATFNDIASLREYETLATEHWIFDKAGAANLVGLKGAITLTQVGATAPTHNAKSLTLAAANGNQLSTGVADQLTYTWAFVVKVPAIDGTTIGKSLCGTDANGVGGAQLSIQGATNYDLWSRIYRPAGIDQHTQNTADATVGSYRFYAFGVDHSGSNRVVRLMSGSTIYDYVSGNQMTPHPSIKLSLGATANSGGGGTNGAEFYEAILFAGALLTPAQLADIRARSIVRNLRHGAITVN